MNITFLIGNGFDIRMGLASSYKAAVKKYVSIPSDDPDICAFKSRMVNDCEYWSDFELAMGKYTREFDSDKQSVYIKCINDFNVELTNYLMAEEKRISYELCNREIKSVFSDSIINFLTDFDYSQAHKSRIFSAISGIRDNIYFRFISFNYTNILCNCLSATFKSSSMVSNHTVSGISYGHFVNNDVIYVHGKFPSQIILGVDNDAQILNKDWAKDRRFCNAIIKPKINQRAGRIDDAEAKKAIDNSCVICIFGMSLGETDVTWWDYIGKWLKKGEHRLIIFVYNPDVSNTLPFPARFDIEDEYVDLFFRLSNIDGKEYDQLRDRIFVVINSKLFDINLVKISEEAQEELLSEDTEKLPADQPSLMPALPA